MQVDSTFFFGDMILRERRRHGWTVRELCHRLNDELSPAFITMMELHNAVPSAEKIFKLADTLGIDKRTLFDAALELKVELYRDALQERYHKALKGYP